MNSTTIPDLYQVSKHPHFNSLPDEDDRARFEYECQLEYTNCDMEGVEYV
jgi:hypothetical protein